MQLESLKSHFFCKRKYEKKKKKLLSRDLVLASKDKVDIGIASFTCFNFTLLFRNGDGDS